MNWNLKKGKNYHIKFENEGNTDKLITIKQATLWYN